MNVQTLTLTYVWTAIGCKINDFFLTNLPDGLVDGFDVVRNLRYILNRAFELRFSILSREKGTFINRTIISNDPMFHVFVP